MHDITKWVLRGFTGEEEGERGGVEGKGYSQHHHTGVRRSWACVRACGREAGWLAGWHDDIQAGGPSEADRTSSPSCQHD